MAMLGILLVAMALLFACGGSGDRNATPVGTMTMAVNASTTSQLLTPNQTVPLTITVTH